MAEREVEVCGSQGGQLRLRLLGSACDGCAGGCAGRCNLFATNESGEFILPAPAGTRVDVGQRLRLCLDDASLRRAAWRGYGLAWLGLLVGAGMGFGLGQLWGRQIDLLTLLGLVAGTFTAVRASRRRLPEPQLQRPDPTIPLVPTTSDRP